MAFLDQYASFVTYWQSFRWYSGKKFDFAPLSLGGYLWRRHHPSLTFAPDLSPLAPGERGPNYLKPYCLTFHVSTHTWSPQEADLVGQILFGVSAAHCAQRHPLGDQITKEIHFQRRWWRKFCKVAHYWKNFFLEILEYLII